MPSVGSTACMDCAAGREAVALGSHQCAVCAASWLLWHEHCSQDCPPGSFAATTGSSKCTLCPVGKFGASHGSLESNDLWFVDSCVCAGMSACLDCGSGTYNPYTGVTVCKGERHTSLWMSDRHCCTACVKGRYTNTDGNTVCTDCNSCTRGWITAAYLFDAGPAGMVQPNANSTACTDCATGLYARVDGMAECTRCAQGKHASNAGMTHCTHCAPGKHVNSLRYIGSTVSLLSTDAKHRCSRMYELHCWQVQPTQWSGSLSALRGGEIHGQ